MKVLSLESVFSVRRPSRNPLARTAARVLLVALPLTGLPSPLLAGTAPAAPAEAPASAAPRLSSDPSARPHPIPSLPRSEAALFERPGSPRSHLWAVATLALRSLKALFAPQVGGGTPEVTREHAFPAGWTLVGVPLQPTDPSASAVFDELGTPLRVYDYVGGQTLGVDDPGFRNVAPGRAHWVLLPTGDTVSATGFLVSTSTPRTIAVAQGWNAISSPWLTAVAWSDARVSVRQGAETRLLGDAIVNGWLDGDLHALNGNVTTVIPPNASPAGEMAPWQGYLLYSHVQGELVLSPPPPDAAPPTLDITGLPDGTEITQPTQIVGTIDDPNLVGWTIEISSGSTGSFVPIASGTGPMTNGVLTTLDPTLLENGLYVLRITATDAAGNVARVDRSIVVEGVAKPGLFSLTFRDLEVPVAGLPIVVSRVYDSRARFTSGDFGFGWRVEIEGRARYRNNRKPGDGWVINPSGGFPSLPCQVPAATRSHLTEIRFSDREVYRFSLEVRSPAPTLGGCFATAAFTQTDGVPGARLDILGNTEVFWQAGSSELIEIDTFEVFEPRDVRLVTASGRQYDLNLQSGLRRIADTNGNSLTIGPGGVTHSSGRGVTFVRDGGGRILQIVDPNGNAMSYGYTGGDLTAFIDREEHTTGFAYSATFPHLLERIDDPRGVQATRAEYDENGRLIAHVDANGNRVEFEDDVDGRRRVVTDRLGKIWVFEYDERGNVNRETDPLGNVTVRTYDARDNRLTETNALGQTTTYAYDASDNETSVRDALGNVTTHTYNAQNKRLTTTDARGKVTTNTYDGSGNLATAVDALGNPATVTYAANGAMATFRDFSGAVTSYEYDTAGNVVRETDALGNVTTFTNDANGNPLTETRTRTVGGSTETLTTTFVYDRLGQLIQVTAPDGTVTRTEYDPAGLKAAVVDAKGRRTTFTYDDLGQLTRTTHPDGTTEDKTHDAEGRPLTSTDRQGRVTRFEHDAAGRLTKTTHPDATFTVNGYDAAGRLVTVTDERGKVTTYGYDAAGRRTSVQDPLGYVTVIAFDAAGNELSVTDPRGNAITSEYDDAGRRVKRILPDGTEERTTYDNMGRTTSLVDQAGRTTQYTYDAVGRLTGVIDAAGQATTSGYNEVGQRTNLTDAAGRQTTFEYDRLGRETKRTLPDGKSTTRTFDETGNVRTQTDFRGRTITLEYDDDDRLAARLYPDGSAIRITYSLDGQRTSVTDARGVTTYTYDARDRLLSRTEPDGRRLEYTYDAAGNRQSVTARVGALVLTTTRAHDAANRLDTVTDPAGRLYDVAHDPNGMRSSLVHPNGLATVYSYDRLERLTGLTTGSPSAGVVQAFTLTLGPAGTRTGIAEQDATARAYAFDVLDRLATERVTRGAVLDYEKTFTHDPVGNRVTQTTSGAGAPGTPTAPGAQTYAYDNRDRLLSDGLAAFEYDDNGNLVARVGDASYTWDFDDRLVRVQKADGSATVEHAYDADGNRVRTTVIPASGPVVTTNFLVDVAADLGNVVAETDQAGLLRAYYVRAEDLFAVMRPDASAPGGWQTRYVHSDAIGTVRRLTNEAASVTDTYTYTAFGELIDHTGVDPQPYAFAGEPLDEDSALQYHRARWLDPRVGRFTSSDPLPASTCDPATLNRYVYAASDPVDKADPSGLMFSLGGLMAGLSGQNTLRNMSTPRHLQTLRRIQGNICRAAARLLKRGNDVYEQFKYSVLRQMTAGTIAQAHHIFQNSVMDELYHSYGRGFGLAMPLLGKSTTVGTPHYLATLEQTRRRGQPPAQVAYYALVAAGCSPRSAREIVKAVENYNEIMGWIP